MLLRLVTTVTLCLFLGLSALSAGAVGTPGPTAAVSAPLAAPGGHAETAAASAEASAEAMDSSAINPVSADDAHDAHDLPESLPRRALTPRPAFRAVFTLDHARRAVLPGSLDGLLRPPKAAVFTA